MYINTTYSSRFYIDENINLSSMFDDIDSTILNFNKILFHTYNLLLLEKNDNESYKNKLSNYKSLHLYVKNTFNLTDYYANSIIRLAKGNLTSQIELQKLYKSNYDEKIKAIKQKLKENEVKLHYFLILRNDFISYRDNFLKNNKKNEKLKIQHFKNISINNDTIVIRFIKNKKVQTINYSLYSFEYEYLNRKIKHCKTLIDKYKHRISNLESKVKRILTLKPIIFGSKKLMRLYSLSLKGKNKKEQKENKQNLLYKKYKEFNISGRCDAKYGNFVFKFTYIPKKDNFDVEFKLMNGNSFHLKDVVIPYRKEEFIKALNSKTPISIGIIKKVDSNHRIYYQFKISFDLSITHKINEDVSTGIVGMDFNIGHLDICDIDAKGNIINSFTIYYVVYSSSKENELSLRQALNKVGEYVSKQHKCLCIEELDTTKSKFKHNSETKNKLFNRIIHSFATNKYESFTNYLQIKYEFKVYKVKPNYTSVIGKYKYAKQRKLNNHIAASYVIARRGLKFKDYLLKQQKLLLDKTILTKHHWTQWFHFNKLVTN